LHGPATSCAAALASQIEEYLLPTIRGERHDCLAMTEPNAGSDVRSMQTRAVRQGGDYLINGSKHFISHADMADFVILFAATDVEAHQELAPRRNHRLSGRPRQPGPDGAPHGPACVSHRGYHQCELFFDDCRVPVRKRLGEEGKGFDLMGEWLGATRLTVAATSVGRGPARARHGDPMGCHAPAVWPAHWALSGHRFQARRHGHRAWKRPTCSRLQAAWKCDQGRMTDSDAAMAKLFAIGGAGPHHRRGLADLWRHGLDELAATWSASGATRGSNASGTAPARFSATSSRAPCCVPTAREADHTRAPACGSG